ncbi:MAG: hypothetical protein M0R17_07390 [Candidatus Omnitrophica bacterium]|jgi:RNA ligase (TIGR02306 family)|nr:hypothetical protein [Candidatus Omnitrophota bacterium]
MNNVAVVVKLKNVRPHPNAERLLLATVLGTQIVVGLDSKKDDIGLYFDSNLRLLPEFLKANNLYRHAELNSDINKTGMFEDTGKVKTIRLRGEISDGFFCPLSSLDFISKQLKYNEGDEFDTVNGIKICEKYVPKYSRTPGAPGSRKSRSPKESIIIDGQFKFHFDTEQLAKNIYKLNPDDLVSITWKLHGTAGISSNLLVKKKLNWIESTFKRLGINIIDTKYDYIYASRKVIKNEPDKEYQHFYDMDIWTDAGVKHFKNQLHKGETIYYEIVGYLPNGGAIQKGKSVAFDYGCELTEYNIFVYRITTTNIDGNIIELQWNQVKQRCNELGVKHVPEIYYDKLNNIFPILENQTVEDWRIDLLQYLKNTYLEKDSIFCKNKLPEEGIVIRKEGNNIESFKLKSFRFLELESKNKDDEKFVDMDDLG